MVIRAVCDISVQYHHFDLGSEYDKQPDLATSERNRFLDTRGAAGGLTVRTHIASGLVRLDLQVAERASDTFDRVMPAPFDASGYIQEFAGPVDFKARSAVMVSSPTDPTVYPELADLLRLIARNRYQVSGLRSFDPSRWDLNFSSSGGPREYYTLFLTPISLLPHAIHHTQTVEPVEASAADDGPSPPDPSNPPRGA